MMPLETQLTASHQDLARVALVKVTFIFIGVKNASVGAAI
jgi:hypothetical protein